jgi:signal transduction histidine kinase
MVAMQPLMLASGFAVGGGLLGVAVSAFLHRRRLQRETRRLASLLESMESTGSVPSTRLNPLAPLLDAAWRRIQATTAQGDEGAAQRRQMAADMVRLMNQSDGAMRAKDRFLAAANHDLRQPLQAMDLALEQLRRDALPAHGPEIAQLASGMRTMTEALDGLLLLSQLDAGTLQANAMACDLQPLFAELLDAQAETARSTGVELRGQAARHAVFTDPGMLGGLLGRLLDNAIKAVPGGGRVFLGARVRGDCIRIEIRDNGIGIAPVHQPRVFDEFFQVGNSERDHRKGFGLGLSIVSRLAALLGTRVELRSRLHGGSCFWLDLPRASVVQRPPRALVVDRDDHQRQALGSMLASWGYAVHAEAAPDAALAHLGSGPGTLDAVLCAIDSPDDPAWQLLHAAKARQARAVRIVLYATPSPALLEATARHEAQALPRPAPPSKLRALLAQRPVPGLRGAA